MDDISYGYIDYPGARLEPDVRRRQISQLLHVIAPAAAMCIVLSAGPEALFPPAMAARTFTGWPWNLLIAMALGVAIWDVRALLLRRRGRGRLTLPVESLPHAVHFAEDALGVSTWAQGIRGYVGSRADAAGIWESQAVLPLAALAYVASGSQHGNAGEWLARTVTGLASADSDEAWREAACAVASADPLLRQSFMRAMCMQPRQRDSVALVMNEAILGTHVAVQR